MVLGQFFHFQIFETLENLGIDFSIDLSKCLRTATNKFEVKLIN